MADELSNRQRWLIYRDVVLGVAPPPDESAAARAWREQMEKEVEAIRAQGFMPDSPPWDWGDDDDDAG